MPHVRAACAVVQNTKSPLKSQMRDLAVRPLTCVGHACDSVHVACLHVYVYYTF